MSNPAFAHSAEHAVCGPLSVSIISNSRLLREGMPLLLAPYLTFRLYEQYSGALLPEFDVAHPPDHVVLIDSTIGHDLVIRWTHYWRACTPAARVVLLELANNTDIILDSIAIGICGYTLEGAAPQEVAEAIRLAGAGLATCSPEITAHLFARLADTAAKPAMPDLRLLLTAREYEVLGYVVEGYSNKQIAAELVIELRTVKQHVHNILAKLNLENRVQAIRIASDAGWFRN